MKGELQEGIADIILPVAPADISQMLYMYAGAIVLTLLAVIIIWRLLYSNKAVCLRALKHNASRHIQQKRYRELVFTVAAVMRERLQCRRLDYSVSLPPALQTREERWLSFLSILQAMRYSNAPLSIKDMQHITREAEYWLRMWP